MNSYILYQLSTLLIHQTFISTPQRRSTTVSIETSPLYIGYQSRLGTGTTQRTGYILLSLNDT